MSRKSIILVGGPDSGKTNYVGRLWISLKEHKGALSRAGMPSNIEYVDSVCANLLKGEFAGRTDTNSERQDFCVPIRIGDSGEPIDLIVPDFTGELWRDAVTNSELPPDWLDALENADGALLFVRVLSEANVQPLDWVTARDTLRLAGEGNEELALPTQVVLCELLRLLQHRLRAGGVDLPRVAVVVTAWDLLDQESQAAGPREYLRRQFPLFAGALEDLVQIDIRVYGVSIVGGDLARDTAFKEKFQHMDMSDTGSVAFERDGALHQDMDITLPVAWAISG